MNDTPTSPGATDGPALPVAVAAEPPPRRGWIDRLRPRTLDLYVLRRFATIFCADLFIFSMLYVMIDGLSQFESFRESSDSTATFIEVAASYYFYTLPGIFCRLLGPVTTMASAMFAVTLTQRANELVPIQATGTSVQRTFLPIVLASLAIVGGSFWIQESWIPRHRHEIRAAKAAGRHREEIRHPTFTDLRKRVKLIAKYYYPFSQHAEGLLLFSMGGRDEPGFVINAREAFWQPGDEGGRWILRDALYQEYAPGGKLVLKSAAEVEAARRELEVPDPRPASPHGLREVEAATTGDGEKNAPREPAGSRLAEHFRAVPLNDLLSRRFQPGFTLTLAPQDLEVENVHATLAELKRRAQESPERHQWMVRYYARIVDPLNHLLLVLLGVPIILWQGSRNVFLSALVAVLVSAAYFILQSLTLYFGNLGLLQPYLAAWTVPILFGSLALTLYVTLRS